MHTRAHKHIHTTHAHICAQDTHTCEHTCSHICTHTHVYARTHTRAVICLSGRLGILTVRSHLNIMGSLLLKVICPLSCSRRDRLLRSAHPQSCTESIPFEALPAKGTVNLKITGNCHGGNFKLRLHWKTHINSSANCILKRITI